MPIPIEQHWDVFLKATHGLAAIRQAKLLANQQRNWLAAITAHACRKAAQNQSLSDLESKLVQTLRAAKCGERLVQSMAHVYTATPPETRAKMFPAQFSNLKPSDSITFANLKAMAPAIVQGIATQANYRNLDVDAIHAGDPAAKAALNIPSQVVQTHGGTIIRAVSKEG